MKDYLKYYTQPAFLICTGILFLAAVGMSAATAFFKVQFIKLPIPLKASLDNLNENAMKPYRVVEKQKITNKEVLEALGTTDYLQWILEDTSVDASSPTRFCSLFITYYTGNPDQVPHVPEECYLGGGRQLQDITGVTIPGQLDGKALQIPVRLVVMTDKMGIGGDNSETVVYFFKVNGQYAGSRDSARKVLQTNFLGKYSYFSKVEWKFYNQGASGLKFPTRAQQNVASQKLLSSVLGLLEHDHWPDWQAANAK